MVLQSIISGEKSCLDQRLFFHSKSGMPLPDCEKGIAIIPRGEEMNTYSYMNLFDGVHWRKLTTVSECECRIKMAGNAVVRLWNHVNRENILLKECIVDNSEETDLIIPFQLQGTGIVFFSVEAKSEVLITEAYYETECESHSIHMSLVICTYKRQLQLKHLLDVIKNSLFFSPGSDFYEKLSIRIVDNGEEMQEQKEGLIKVYHNSNTGGSGGFLRGIKESRADEQKYGITNVILMDDDVKLIPESLYRLYALLSGLRPEYCQHVVAGRMFREDMPAVQYTAAEIWNDSDIQHVGFQENMTQRESLENINACNGEYTGWWFGCFPMDFIRENDPLPFFLHCDDVEYGLRHGGVPIILNGIQVWHETADNKQTPRIDYYDVRNSMIVNSLLGMPAEQIVNRWFQKISMFHSQGKVFSEYMAIRAMEDFLKGEDWLYRIDAQKLDQKLASVSAGKWMRYTNAIRWRLAIWKSRRITVAFRREKRS